MSAAKAHPISDEEGLLFRLLRQLDLAPDVSSQRAIASALGVSLGRLNALLRTAAEAGFISISEREGPDRRRGSPML